MSNNTMTWFRKSDIGRGAVLGAALFLCLGIFSAQAYQVPAGTTDPNYKNFDSINLNDLKNIPLPNLSSISIPTSISTSSFEFSQFFNVGSLFRDGLSGTAGSIITLVINITIAMAGVLVRILGLLRSYIH